MKPDLQAAQAVTEFCLSKGKRLFDGWPVRTLFTYVFFHLTDGTCFVSRGRGKIKAVAFAWRMPAHEIFTNHEVRKSLFSWRIHQQADAIFVAEVIGNQKRLPHLIRQGMARFPDWQSFSIYTCRRDGKKLVQLKPDLLARLCPDTSGRSACEPSRAGETLISQRRD